MFDLESRLIASLEEDEARVRVFRQRAERILSPSVRARPADSIMLHHSHSTHALSQRDISVSACHPSRQALAAARFHGSRPNSLDTYSGALVRIRSAIGSGATETDRSRTSASRPSGPVDSQEEQFRSLALAAKAKRQDVVQRNGEQHERPGQSEQAWSRVPRPVEDADWCRCTASVHCRPTRMPSQGERREEDQRGDGQHPAEVPR